MRLGEKDDIRQRTKAITLFKSKCSYKTESCQRTENHKLEEFWFI